jgi:hypothetical protein
MVRFNYQAQSASAISSQIATYIEYDLRTGYRTQGKIVLFGRYKKGKQICGICTTLLKTIHY